MKDYLSFEGLSHFFDKLIEKFNALLDDKANTADLHEVATSGSWNDLEDRPYYWKDTTSDIFTIENVTVSDGSVETNIGTFDAAYQTFTDYVVIIDGEIYRINFTEAQSSVTLQCGDYSIDLQFDGRSGYTYAYWLASDDSVSHTVSVGYSQTTWEEINNEHFVKSDYNSYVTIEGIDTTRISLGSNNGVPTGIIGINFGGGWGYTSVGDLNGKIIYLKSSTNGSAKKYAITVNDNGKIVCTNVDDSTDTVTFVTTKELEDVDLLVTDDDNGNVTMVISHS